MHSTNKRDRSNYRSRRVEFDWKDDAVIQLISAVHDRRQLWDDLPPELKRPKEDLWREVVAEIGCSGITTDEVRAKWSALRCTYKVNKNKRAKRMAEEGLTEPPKVAWRHFDSMQFLEFKYADEIKNSIGVNKMSLTSLDSDDSTGLDYPTPASPKPDTLMKRKRKRRMSLAYSTNSAHSDPLSVENEEIIDKKMPTMATNDMSCTYQHESEAAAADLVATDRNTSFCQHILAELEALSEVNAFALRRTLNRAMWDFLEAINYAAPIKQQQRQNTIVPDRG